MKENVLIVHNYYQIPGGEDTAVENEKKMLEENGHKVVLYTRHNSELNSISKMKKLALPLSTVFNLRTYREVKKLILKEKIDVVHVHNTLNMVSPSVYLPLYIRRRLHRSYSLTLRSIMTSIRQSISEPTGTAMTVSL